MSEVIRKSITLLARKHGLLCFYCHLIGGDGRDFYECKSGNQNRTCKRGSTGGDLNSFGFKQALLRDMGDFPFAKRAYKGPYLGSYAEVNYRLTKKDDAQSQAEEMV